MTDRSAPKEGVYFDGDIGMAAAALIEMFGDAAPARIGERVKEARRKGNDEGVRFWQAIADEVSRRLMPNKGR